MEEGKHYAADLAIGQVEDRVLVGREEGIALDGEAQAADIDCVHPWQEVSAVSAAGGHSMLLGSSPLAVDIVALRVPSAP